jgi:hypothetical protein
MKLNEMIDAQEQYRQGLIKTVKDNLPHLLDTLDFNIQMFSKYKGAPEQARLAEMKLARDELLRIAQGQLEGRPSSYVMNMLYGLSMTDRDTRGT